MRLLSLSLVSALVVVACNDPSPPPAVSPEASTRPAQTASPATASATTAAPVPSIRIAITAHGDATQASPAMPPGTKTRPHVSGYRIEPAAGGGYDVVEEATGQPERRGKLSDDSVRGLVAKASDYAKKGCKMTPSPHNDPRIHIEGAASVDARGGIAQCESGLSPSACTECKDGFRDLHAAIVGVAKAALP